MMNTQAKSREKTAVRPGSALVEIAIAVLIALAVSLVVRVFGVQVTQVSGASMSPTLNGSQRVVINMLVYRLADPQRGDITLCKYPDRPETFIKRVIALPGEMVMIRGGQVFVDGRALREPYCTNAAKTDYGPTIVPKDSYFVMGDNRPVSGDCRLESVGALPKGNLIGRAEAILMPFSEFSWLKGR